jgi:hypothetical protein
VNTSPQLNIDAPVDTAVKGHMLRDLVTLMGLHVSDTDLVDRQFPFVPPFSSDSSADEDDDGYDVAPARSVHSSSRRPTSLLPSRSKALSAFAPSGHRVSVLSASHSTKRAVAPARPAPVCLPSIKSKSAQSRIASAARPTATSGPTHSKGSLPRGLDGPSVCGSFVRVLPCSPETVVMASGSPADIKAAVMHIKRGSAVPPLF